MPPEQPGTPKQSDDSAKPQAGGAPSFATPPTLSLPKGGGAIQGIGEKFSVNAATGTGGMTIPIAVSPGRSGFGPQLALSYDSGSGNGPFGFGWSLSLPQITRKTDKGLPQYRDDEESDVFILSGAEDLVPTLAFDGTAWKRVVHERTVDGIRFRVFQYRPRIEGLFARIERWLDLDAGVSHWRSISRDNVTTLYGRTEESRIADPTHPERIFSWRICQSFDDRGNAIVYEYRAENSEAVDLTQANERNRSDLSRSANRLLKRIRYGNRKSRLIEPDLAKAEWMFEVVFDYGEHDDATPLPRGARPWPCRDDSFSTYRAGFEVRTYRLCRRVLMFHHFPGEPGVGSDCLVRSTDLTYRTAQVASFITAAVQSGYKRNQDGSYLKRSLPPLDLWYSEAIIGEEVREIDRESAENLPAGVDGNFQRWVDLDGEGLSGVLSEQADQWFYKRNLGQGRLGPLEVVLAKPSLAALGRGRQQLLDVAGDGQLDLVALSGPTPGFFERTADASWDPFTPFASLPRIDFDDPNLRFVDLDGDGHPDILLSDSDVFTWYPSLARDGYGAARQVRKPLDEEKGPTLVFADESQSIYLADMSGDGLADLVRIRNGEICYWPNSGYGRFGGKVTMDDAPRFDFDDRFDQRRIRLADIDASGTTDIIYLGAEGPQIYFNESGNRWSKIRILRSAPPIDDPATVATADLLGNGTACLVWSLRLAEGASAPLRYIALMRDGKPHLLVGSANNLGAETRVSYVPSTKFYLADKAAGTPWVTRLPFPVHVVERVETWDHISRNRFVTRYAYHHGFYDGIEREFRGFGRVDHWDTEELGALGSGEFPTGDNFDAASHVPPVLTKAWFHTGVFEAGFASRSLAHEYYREGSVLSDRQRAAATILDSALPTTIRLPDGSAHPWDPTADELCEASRAFKGALLRQEIYAVDGSDAQDRPYRVSQHSLTCECFQPTSGQRHAVYFAHAREAADFHYERALYVLPDGKTVADPRVSHALTLDVDAFGNVLSAVNIGYGRRLAPSDPALTSEDHEQQKRALVTYSENRFTNAVILDDAYRCPSIAESKSYEILQLTPDSTEAQTTNFFRIAELQRKLPLSARNLIECTRTTYRSDDLGTPLPLGIQESCAFAEEAFRLALTPELRSRYERNGQELLSDTKPLLDAGYVLSEDQWWARSGRVRYSFEDGDTTAAELDEARAHFFLPRRYQDPFGHTTRVRHDPHDLLALEAEDALHNRTTVGERAADGYVHNGNDYRVLKPALIMDANGNRSAVAFDVLGMVAGTALMGKPHERRGDSLVGFKVDLSPDEIDAFFASPASAAPALIGDATSRMLYDPDRFMRDRAAYRPNWAASIARETHSADLGSGQISRLQIHIAFSDGFGREVQRKTLADSGPIVAGGPVIAPRWVASSWTIFNNKGKPVRKYEPFFDDSHDFRFGKTVGVSPILFYDPAERVVATLFPNHSWQKVVFDPWYQQSWDVNDTVLSDSRSDPDVGAFLRRLPEQTYLPTWYEQRIRGDERDAAEKTAAHANTPTTAHFDTLGRLFVTITFNRTRFGDQLVESRSRTATRLDIHGHELSVTDALAREVSRSEYNLLGIHIRHYSADAGERWHLADVAGKPVLYWDARGNRTRWSYDGLGRMKARFCRTADEPEWLEEKAVYGEEHPEADKLNLRGKPFQHFDSAGLATNASYDFKGNTVTATRRLSASYQTPTDWFLPSTLEDETFISQTTFDACNRPVRLVAPDGSIASLSYNESGFLSALSVQLRGAESPTPFVSHIEYNARGQRQLISYGNGTVTSYERDPQTFNLLRLKTTRPGDGAALQDLHYQYDPSGNVTQVVDRALPTIYFDNQVVDASASYWYDASYRLVRATGREHIGQVDRPGVFFDDGARMNQPLPSDGHAMRNYSEAYQYDLVGNILSLVHSANNGSWTRKYSYESTCNRLVTTTVGNLIERYGHDSHGNMMSMPHLPLLRWDHRDRLQATSRQLVSDGTPETTYYVYDSAGRRARKVTVSSNGNRKQERIYIGGFEIYREYQGNGIGLERQTLRVMDDKQCIALVETRTVGEDVAPAQLARYQCSSHVGSVTLETDEQARIISYEEYYPYGSTSFTATRSQTETPKRYRYADKERDDETGLTYYGARYWAPWLGRWISADPAAGSADTNLYIGIGNNPVSRIDPDGAKDVTVIDKDHGSVSRRMSTESPEFQRNYVANNIAYVQYVSSAFAREVPEHRKITVHYRDGRVRVFQPDELPVRRQQGPAVTEAHGQRLIRVHFEPPEEYVKEGGFIRPKIYTEKNAAGLIDIATTVELNHVLKEKLLEIAELTNTFAKLIGVNAAGASFANSVHEAPTISLRFRGKAVQTEEPSIGASGDKLTKVPPLNDETGSLGRENCVRCVTALIDAIENEGVVLKASEYPKRAGFPTVEGAKSYITQQTGVTFSSEPTSNLTQPGDYVVFNKFVKPGAGGSMRPTHILWARVRPNGTMYFYDPQTGAKPTARQVGAYQAYQIRGSH
jgi:RHS repeat-associated protein